MQRTAFSVVIPAYNEGSSISNVLSRVTETLAHLEDRFETELIVVNDGSSDATGTELESFASARPGSLRIVTHERNRGLEAAIVTGARAATHGVLVLLDADLSYAPGIIEPLVTRLVESGAAAVLASPYMAGGHVANVPFVRLWASRGANALLSLCVGGRIKTFYRNGACLRYARLAPHFGRIARWGVQHVDRRESDRFRPGRSKRFPRH